MLRRCEFRMHECEPCRHRRALLMGSALGGSTSGQPLAALGARSEPGKVVPAAAELPL